jgi:glycosyltransferase involved in cell wall biosynthesis
VIIVDDGSTDATLDVIEAWKLKYQKEDFQIEIYTQENSGAPAARNKGIHHIKGQYVQFLDSDDILHPLRLELLVKEFERGADFIHTGFANFIETPDEPISILKGNINLPLKSQIIQGRAWLNTLRDAMITELLKKTGLWEEDLICFEDREFMERAALLSNNPVVIKESLAFAERDSSTRISDKQITMEGRAIRIVCEKRIVEWVLNNELVVDKIDLVLLKSRLYGLAFRTRASGWDILAKECYNLAESINAPQNNKAKQRRWVYKSGKFGSRVYEYIANLKNNK